MIYSYKDKQPDTEKAVFIAPSADIIGDVTLGKDVSVWFNATIRADLAAVTIGEGTNVQDNSVVHVDKDVPANIGKNVVIGHNAILHGCTVGDNSLVGMGAIVLNNAVIGKECVIGAAALVTENKQFPDRSLIVGSPAKAVRTISDADAERLHEAARGYIEKGKATRESLR
jgi:carbonic anhydrase/acetyltransferase-like protein (isoleucine patch superfamily)